MILFVFGLLFFVGALVAGTVSFFSGGATTLSHTSVRMIANCWFVGLLFVAGALTFVSCIRSVGTKDVGVEVSFGHVDGHLSNGFHLTAPWVGVTSMDAAIQTDSYGTGSGENGPCVNVRIANQQTACVELSIRWRIKPGSADYLFQNYRTFDQVRTSLVTRELHAAANAQLGTYNPLNSVEGSQSGNLSYQQIAANITTQMQSEIGGNIDVLNTIMPLVSFDPATQARINQLQQQVALTRIAAQQIQTNQDQARANDALAASVSSNPAVNTANCLTALNTAIKDNYTLPAGFSCFGGSSAVVVPAAGK